ncbi:MAG TPA: S8 family serine peptidase [Propionicimonas sp.]|uniref:S8 family serine peptidase n=1 Tax=Propionicimonas sp. TaxID=1955623 RepID=UPI002F400376
MTIQNPPIQALGTTPTPPAPTAWTAPSSKPTLPSDALGRATYIVGFGSQDDASGVAARVSGLGGEVTQTLTAIPGMIALLTPTQRDHLAQDSAVTSIESDHAVSAHATQDAAPWGLDRLDQADANLSGTYTYNTAGKGVQVFVVDSGLNRHHVDFRGRVRSGADFVGDGRGTDDCNGHGTHVAGTILGTHVGVAKNATVIPVRVLDCDGNGDTSKAIVAMDWVVAHHKAGQPAVVNVSLGGDLSPMVNAVVGRMLADGIVVVVAAGNEAQDACAASPASARSALTVAASDRRDQQASYSNGGPCVDLFAPGDDIYSADAFDSGGYVSMSGTSMASPHVAGVAALILGEHRRWSPSRVIATLMDMTLKDRITNVAVGTPNRLVSIAPTVTGLSVTSGRPSGGQRIAITGTNFTSGTTVRFDSKKARRVSTVRSTRLVVTTPAHRAGTAATLRVAASYSTATLPAGFWFLPPPTLARLSAATGPTTGGTQLVVTGSNFLNARRITFGGVPAEIQVLTGSTILATAPPHPPGAVRIRITTASGTSKSVPAGIFTYLAETRLSGPASEPQRSFLDVRS